MQQQRGNLYDYPKYYDLVFGADWRAEFDFLRKCFDRYGRRSATRLFEPACGTGRLLFRFAKAGYDVAGNDLNPHAVKYCNDRLERHGFPPAAVVGDMADFHVRDLPGRKKFDAAFNMINSIRHLPTEQQAASHLRCVANALKQGGLYVLGLHLIPTAGSRMEQEQWVARRGNLSVVSNLWSKELNLKQRNERLGMNFDVWTPTRVFRLLDEMNYRTYTAKQIRRLFARVPELETVATYDFHYDIRHPVEVNETTEDVVFVLRKR